MTKKADRPPDFLVVGTPRSGTTLVQRLVAELPGVRVTPETHFFPLFYEQHLRNRTFPLEEAQLREVLGHYTSMRVVEGLRLDVDAIVNKLDGTCSSAWELFSALIGDLAGEAELVGEKTPNHLRWWRPLSQASPDLKFIAVVRDPRAVVASMLDVPFGMKSALLLAFQWREDMRELELASRGLSPDQLLMLRFEDVVNSPSRAQGQVAEFLGITGSPIPLAAEEEISLFPSWESPWKGRATGPVERTRVDAWRSRLSGREVRTIESVAGRFMRREGYTLQGRGGLVGLFAHGAASPKDVLRLARSRRARLGQRRLINDTEVSVDTT